MEPQWFNPAKSASGSGSRSDSPTQTGPGKELIPDAPPVVPDHELLYRIGSGSYGQVWLAHNVLGTLRAVKVIYRACFDNDRPYEREFHGIQKFEPVSRSHSGLIDILQVGRNDEEGYFYYVMELADDAGKPSSPEPAAGEGPSQRAPVAGGPAPHWYQPKTLHSVLKEHRPLPLDECARIGLALSESLAHLHKNGLIHRDIKPANIIFVHGVAKLADIGLVTELDATRSFVGTEGFIPPEGPGTPQSDIYSLGKVLYEMATGKDRQQYPDLPTMLGTETNSRRLLEFNEIFVKACDVDPKKRYRSAGGLHNDLELLQGGRSIKRLRWLERQMAMAQRIAAVLLLLGLVLGFAAYQAYRAHQVSQASLAQVHLAQGSHLMEEGQLLQALLPLTKALELDQGNPERESRHRIRIASTLEQCPIPIAFFPSETEPIIDATFSADGSKVLTIPEGNTVRVWDVQSGAVLYELPHDYRVVLGRFSPDGTRILTGTMDSRAHLWDGRDGTSVASGLTNCYRSLWKGKIGFYYVQKSLGDIILLKRNSGSHPWPAPIPNENVVLVLSLSGRGDDVSITIKVLEAGGEQRELFSKTVVDTPALDAELWPNGQEPENYLGRVGAPGFGILARSPNPEARETILDNFRVRIIENNTGQVLKDWMVDDFDDNGVEDWSVHGWDPEHTFIVATNGQLNIEVDGTQGTYVELMKHPTPVFEIRPGRTLEFQMTIKSAPKSDVHLCFVVQCPKNDVMSWQERFAGVRRYTGTPMKLQGAFTPQGDHFFTIPQSRTLRLNDAKVALTIGPPLRHPQDIWQVLPFHKGWRVATVQRDTVRVWDGMSGDLLVAVNHSSAIADAALSPDDRLIAMAGDHEVSVFSLQENRFTFPPLTFAEVVRLVGFSPNSQQLLVATEGKQVLGWSAVTGERIIGPISHTHHVTGVGFSPDGGKILTVTGGNQVQFWDATTGEELKPSLPHLSKAGLPEFNRFGTLLLTVHPRLGALVWDWTKARRPILAVPPCPSLARVALSSDDQYQATLESDNRVRLSGLDQSTGRPLDVPPLKHQTALRQAIFGRDPNFLVVEDQERKAHLWHVHSGERLAPPIGTRYEPYGEPAIDLALREDHRPVEDLSRLARLLAGEELGDDANRHSIQPSVVSSILADLKSRYPGHFESEKQTTLTWHERQASLAEQTWNWHGAALHLSCLVELSPGNVPFRMRLEYAKQAWDHALQAARKSTVPGTVIPPRPWNATANMLDLSSCYTVSLKEDLLTGGRGEETLQNLPSGVRRLAGTEFDLRGVAFADPTECFVSVGRKAERIHFLHSHMDIGIGNYLVHYVNGEAIQLPVERYSALIHIHHGSAINPLYPLPRGEETSDSWPFEESLLAWAGVNPAVQKQAGLVLLNRLTWQNPYPEKVIERIGFSCPKERDILVVAISLE